MLMPALLMQKPCKKSTAKQHTEYLNKRLDSWEKGDFELLMKESRAIQDRLRQNRSKHETEEHSAKIFANLMLQGKVHAALRVLDKAANMTRKLCTEEITKPMDVNSLEAYAASRLVPLEKEPAGIRPIGIGEVLRRIVGKTIVAEIKPEIMESAGFLQWYGAQKCG